MNVKPCDGCCKEVDFSIHAHGWCNTHSKEYCWKCVHEYKCQSEGNILDGSCKRVIMTNPSWTVKLRKTHAE